jgi:DNA polymerase II large subunit
VLCRIVGHNKAQAHYGHPYFHAAKRRNCVPGDAQLWVLERGQAALRRIADLVEPAFARAPGGRGRPLDAFGTEAAPLAGVEVLSLDPTTLHPRKLRVTKAIRGRTQAWVRLRTKGGRLFVCTPDHNVLTREAGTWVVKAAEKVSPGDLVPAARRAPDVPGVALASDAVVLPVNEWFGLDAVDRVDVIEHEAATYCIDVDSGVPDLASKNVLWGSGLYQIRCDGDEDCVMLLMDGLLNFSRAYLPSTRGGLMDAPLTLTMRIDPSEVDKEAHNVDVAWRYPLEFYEATEKHPSPKDVEKLVERTADRLGKPSQYEGFGYTHDTTDVADGPAMSAYKTIGSMMEKMDAQLGLAAKLRAVDAPDVAARIIGSHFLPDLMGNLKAFSKQGVRCTKCQAKYRRVPLSGKCRKCGGATLTMTVYEASVKKYLEVSKQVGERFAIDSYTRQRIEHVSDSIESTFSNDRVKKAKLTDFF